MTTVQYPEGWTLTYCDRGGHNVRLDDGRGLVITTGAGSLVAAIQWAAQQMARA